MYKKNACGWKLIVDIFKFMHVPFQSNDKKLKVEVSNDVLKDRSISVLYDRQLLLGY
jgi:hypothetical protein